MEDSATTEVIDLDKYDIDKGIFDEIDMDLIKEYEVFPYKFNENEIFIAAYKELTIDEIKDLKFIFKRHLIISKGQKLQIINYINIYTNIKSGQKAIEEIKLQKSSKEKGYHSEINKEEYAPTVCLADSIISLAITQNASDIHIEPFKDTVYIRIRVDGVLRELMEIPREAYESIIIRIKIMAKLNITIRKLPQDGRSDYVDNGTNYDLRISTMPTIFGEKSVIRILYKSKASLTFEEITGSKSSLIFELLKRPHGIILVTGPTGSGKTTTLYSMLNKINNVEKNIVTIEDPVEVIVNRVNQINVNNKAGLTFAKGLRNVLRQDPDIIMVGEIRDEETAEIAIRAAITGHLVLSTLHTNDSFSAISRLRDMGIEKYLIADALNGVIAQRLVRKICCECKEEYIPNEYERKFLNLNNKDRLYKGRGCSKCNYSGYLGRKAVFEVIALDNVSRRIISLSEDCEELKKHFIQKYVKTLKDSTEELVRNGDTTFSEFLRISDNLEVRV